MTAPAYSTDLTDLTTAESGTWGEITGYTSGGTPAPGDTDYFIQGSGCTSQSTAGKTGLVVSMYFDSTSDKSGVITTGMCVFFWQVLLMGNAIDTFDNGGLRLGVGSGIGAFDMYKSGGKDFGRNPYGGWQNVAIDPRYAGGADYSIGGGAGGNWRYFASQPNLLSSISKGSPHALDAIRYGRGQIKALYGATADGYATFDGMAAKNDANDATDGYNRWGLFQAIAGGYLWKGLMSIGDDSTAADFRDTNKNISIDDCPRTYASFNRLEVRNANTKLYLDTVFFTALGTLARGEFEAIANADIQLTNCGFTDMSTFIFQSNSQLNGCAWRRCSQVTQGTGLFNACLFSRSDAAVALVMNDKSKVTNCEFVSSGTGHAIQGFPSAGSFDISDLSFSGYAAEDGSTGDEAIYVTATTGTVTLNYSGTEPSVRSAGATIVKQTSQITLTISPVVTGSDVVIYEAGTTTVLQYDEDIAGTASQYVYGGDEVEDLIDVGIFKAGYTPFYIRGYELGGNNATLPVAQQVDRFYIE